MPGKDVTTTTRISTGASWLSGSVSGLASATLLQPLDVARTQMQRNPFGAKVTTAQAMSTIVEKNGFTALWRGLTPTVARVGFGTGMYFSLLNYMSIAWSEPSKTPGGGSKLSGPRAFVAGFTARAVASVTLLPLTVVKTRFEAGDKTYGGLFRTLMCIARKERARALFRGLVPTVLRDAPFSGVYYAAYNRLKSLCTQQPWLSSLPKQVQNFGAGMLAGALASLVTNPFDVVRTRMQLGQAQGQNTLAVALHISTQEGYGALLRGLMPRVYKKSLAAGISWTVYEEGVRALSKMPSQTASSNTAMTPKMQHAAKL